MVCINRSLELSRSISSQDETVLFFLSRELRMNYNRFVG
ncbi:hypothetical protein LEP1GSC133_3029 [Leptospira borgpetersenii serovar Pomona str. 200901868]|uniref:Uncharacterized protein n=1 Tax=Leptospira borgpetersenii serovar Pomona str. 200901868 TaxID=1192866 RepID=M6W4I7_LEPBO|nr:hypothetical protein LEP1GSC137_0558 [Leptospira borgpetersenii str. Noumea 25]EMO64647.1 hypothetical protein LEP1GSC133_3029 [Leptospira borgpetersenii serovar Pomona str. 200901868]